MNDNHDERQDDEEEEVGGLEPKQQTLLKSSVLMASGTLTSRILGFIKSALLVAALGASAGAMGSFQVANTLPNMVYNLLAAGIIDAVLIPQIVRALKSRAGNEYVNKLLTAAGALLFLLTLAAMVATPVIVTILASAYSPEMRALTITFALICVPQIFFYGLYNLLGELLNARGIFGPYMWAPVVNNIVGIASLIAFLVIWGSAGDIRPAESMTSEQILMVAGMATVGVIAQALILLIPMRKSGLKLRIDFRLKGTNFGSASKVAFWTFATLLMSQFAVVSTSQLATRADAYTSATGDLVAGNPAYQYAFMIYMVPSSLIALTLATAIFTRLANDVADGNIKGVAENYHRGVDLIVLLSFYAAAVLIVAANPMMQIIMPTLPPTSASLYGMVLVALVFALPSGGLTMMSQRVFFAFENARPVFLIAIVPIVLQLAIGWSVYLIAEPRWWTVGAAAGETVYRVVQGFVALVWAGILVRQINVGRVVAFYLRCMVSFAISALVAWAVLHFIGPSSSAESTIGRFFDGTWKTVLVAIIVAVVYFGILRIFDPSGMNEVLGALVARFRPRTQSEPASPTKARPPGEEVDSEAELDDLTADDAPGALPITEKRGRTLPQAASWADEPPEWNELFSSSTQAAVLATQTLNRGASFLDMAATGAIPTLTGELGVSPRARGVEEQGNVENHVVRKDHFVSEHRTSSQGAPVASTAGGKGFNPTIPALILGLILVLVAGFFAVRTLMGPGPTDLFAEIGGSVSQSSQSSQSGELEEEEAVVEGPVPTVAPVVTSATVFSWNDDDGDHPELASAIVDTDPSTVWRSRYFTTNAFEEGSEISILLTLAEPAVVSEITLNVVGSGGEVVVRNPADGNPRVGDVLATAPIDGQTVIRLAQPTELSAISLSFNTLPVDDEGMNRAKLAGISVQ